MPIALNSNSASLMTSPAGYPLVLSATGELFAEGVIPKGALAVAAKVKATLGVTTNGTATPTANTYLGSATVTAALFAMPSTSGGADGAEIAGTRASVVVAGAEETLTVTAPTASTTAPAAYLWKLWVEGLTGTNLVSVSEVRVA